MARRGPMVAALVTVASVALGGQAAASPKPEKEPNPKACVHSNPSIQRPTAAQLALPYWPEQMLRYDQAWTYTRGAKVTVAVVDSGVDATHEQLARHVVPGYDVTSGRVRSGGTTDCAGHGTLVSGIIAAQPMPGRSMVGIAPDVTILPVRETWGIDDYGNPTSGSADALLRALRVAVQHAQIVNVSITVADVELRQAQRQAFNDIAQYASDHNVLIVAASGNKSQYTRLHDQSFATYPAQLARWYRNVIAVSGVGANGQPDQDAVTGPFVTVAAPDQGFLSTLEHGGLVSVTGTSFAAPMVTGLAALVRARFADASAADVRARIVATAEHPSTTLPDPSLGYGIVNPLAAMTAVLPPTATTPATPAAARRLGVRTDAEARIGTAALIAGAGAVALTGLLAFGAVVVRHGRRRGWRPGVAGRAQAGASPPSGR
jgi:membrane-anchored mycosin MYCP